MSKGIGVYIGRNEVIVVSAARSAGGPQVKAFASEPIQREVSQEPLEDKKGNKKKRLTPEARAVRKALEKIKEPGAYVTAAVSPSLVATRHFVMPSIPKKDEARAIHHEATRYIPFKLSECIMDYHTRVTQKNVSSVTVTAIRHEVLQTSLEDLHAASAKVLMIEPVYCAVARAFSALHMLVKAKTQGFVVLQSDGNVHVTFASDGVVFLSRDFLLSWNSDEDKGRFTDELKASIDYFFKLTGGETLTQIYLAGAGDLKLWAEHLEHAFNYTIRFDSANFPNEKNIPPEALHSALVAFGLALRSLNYSSPLGDISLLPRQDRSSEPSKMLGFLAAECAVLFILFILVRFLILQPALTHLKNENQAILGPMISRYPEFMSRSMNELAAEKESLRPRTRQLKDFLKTRGQPSGLLLALAQGLPLSIALESISLEATTDASESGPGKSGKKLIVRGLCYIGSAEKETNVVNEWVRSLAANTALSAVFSDIKLEEVGREKRRDKAMTRFSIVGE